MKLFKRSAAALLSGAMLLTQAAILPELHIQTAAADLCTVNINKTYQKIDGFGGMNHPEWTGKDLTDAQRQKAFGNGKDELGLSIVRIFVNPDSSQWNKAVPTAKYASEHGVTVFASPWEPPKNLAESGSGKGGKLHLPKSNYAAYAKHLNDFGNYMKNQGVNLYSISVQNEPDYASEWTVWSTDETTDFLANYADQITSTRVMSPESFQYAPENASWVADGGKKFYAKILNNQKAFANCDLFGTHFYGTQRAWMDYPALESCGKPIWMTEVYTDSKNDADVWPMALDVSENIHNSLVVGNMSAYVWWYIRRSYGPLKEDGTISKRGYCMAQYSKFVRPGDVRVDATEQPQKDLYISAYKNSKNQVTVVAVNKSDSGYTQQFSLGGKGIADVDRYRTSQNENLALTENLEIENGSGFWAQLPAKSVSTFIVTLDGGLTPADPTQPATQPATQPSGTEGMNGTLIRNLVVSDTENAADWSIQKNFGAGVQLYGDRDLTCASSDALVDGCEFIRTACDSKLYTGDLAAFEAAKDMFVYAAVDQRVDANLSWLGSWKKTGAVITSANDVTFSLYQKQVKAGEKVTLGTNGGEGNSANYLIFASETNKGPAARGDVNNDGVIDIFDLGLAKQGILKGNAPAAADVDGNGKAEVTDLILLTKWLHHLITEFPQVEPEIPAQDTAKLVAAFNGVTAAKSYKALTEHNPILTQYFGADPGVMEYNGRIYVYMTDDALIYENGKVSKNVYSKITHLRCISSDDLVNWTDHGLINAVGQGGAAKWAGNSWAPTACHKKINGKEKFFLYFANNANGIGVLTADSPTGPWTDPIGKPLISRSTPNCSNKDVVWLFDPAVLVDDDGKGYLYFGGGTDGKPSANPKTSRAVQLGDDMTSIVGTPVTIDAPYIFEDSGIHKYNGKYYYSYCTNWNTGGNNLGLSTAAIDYMVSDKPLGPFTYKGEVFKNIGQFFGTTGNNHHTIMEFDGEYYLFYHAQLLQDAMGYNGLGYRTTHIDKITVNSDGSMKQVTGTKTGVTQIKALDPFKTVEAETLSHQGGITISGSGNTTVNLNKGAWFGVTGADCGTGAKSITVRASSQNGAVLKVCKGSASGDAAAYIEIPAGGMQEITAPVTGLSGKQNLFIISSGNAAVDNWKLNN